MRSTTYTTTSRRQGTRPYWIYAEWYSQIHKGAVATTKRSKMRSNNSEDDHWASTMWHFYHVSALQYNNESWLLS